LYAAAEAASTPDLGQEARMRDFIPVIGIALICSSCALAPPSPPLFSQVTSQVAPDSPNCRDYSAQATVDGKQQEIIGRACQQDDGSWRIAEGPSGQPVQFVTVYAPPPYDYYSYYDPWLWGWPIGLSLGASVLFVDRDHRFHHVQFANRHDGFGFGGIRGGFGGFGGMHRGWTGGRTS
jgi:hypothetical protein